MGVREHCPSKKAFLSLKRVFRRKKVFKKRPDGLLSSHFPSKKPLRVSSDAVDLGQSSKISKFQGHGAHFEVKNMSLSQNTQIK